MNASSEHADMPALIHSATQVRTLDRMAIEQLSVSGYELMTRAAVASLNALRDAWPNAPRLIIVCGFGNNAGDGYVLARLAHATGLRVHVMSVGDPALLGGDAARAWREFLAAGGVVHPWHAQELAHAGGQDVIVDAILGTGLSRPLTGDTLACVQAINHSTAPVMSLDVPTGLDADTGCVQGAAVRAGLTVTFVGLKQGLYLGEGPDYIGNLLFDDLGVPTQFAQQVGGVAQLTNDELVRDALPRRAHTAHKGRHGHVLVIGGGLGMPGAVRLCGEACLRAGAGLVSVATRPEHVNALVTGRPELMVHGVMSVAELQPLIARADVIAVGPGLGQDGWAQQLWAAAFAASKPMVVDADALNLLAAARRKCDHWILTPHPGEAARLLKCTTAEIQTARMPVIRQITDLYGGVVVLKGAGTLVACDGELPALCDRGNPGMAAPGMGDVLTGVIAGITAQCGDLWLAARAGVYVHATAGDLAAQQGERGMLASDLLLQVQRCVNP
jgi:ADP-dependent NAD(P)H-hydrate dehydratase / NAD(P)H-hydrate epimerase